MSHACACGWSATAPQRAGPFRKERPSGPLRPPYGKAARAAAPARRPPRRELRLSARPPLGERRDPPPHRRRPEAGALAMVDVERLYREHSDYVRRVVRHRFARRHVPDALIEDACAQAWLIAWRQRDRIEDARPIGFVIVVATHEVFALLRKRRGERGGQAIEEFASVGDPELALEAREALEALGALKPQQREALALRVGGYSYC